MGFKHPGRSGRQARGRVNLAPLRIRRRFDRLVFSVIEIPGYKVLSQLGRGGMATVYLALQESVDREVALKVMSPALMVDPNFGERFLREARIAAKLHHRHVVGVHDVGKYNDIHYIAMEYLPGGSLHIDDGKPLEPTKVLRAVREIATALAYAHSKGFVHRDIKPDNILLHDDGSAALTDFGIARANDSATRMTRTGAVIGTPHYMSPEQARGRPLDGRADLYSLGVVLFELLTGYAPFIADDPLAVGIMHITEPVPALPPQVSQLQGVVDKLMAKTPEDRFQTGEDVAAAISDIELAIAQGDLPGLTAPDDDYSRRVFSEASRTQRMPTTRTPTETFGGRTEPMIGVTDEASRTERRPVAVGAAARAAAITADRGPRRWPWVLLVLLLGAGVGLWLGQDKLRQMLPNSDVSVSLAQAQAALAQGNLIGNDQSARALYESVLRVDPDHQQAREGLQRVGEAVLTEASIALGKRRFDEARAMGGVAREILRGGSALEDFETQLQSNEQSHLKVGDLLVQGEAALKAQNLLGEQGALALYQKALTVDVTNSIAIKGIDNSLVALSAQATAALDKGDLAAASISIEEIARASQNYSALPDLRARLVSGQTNAIDALTQDLALAERNLLDGALNSPRGANALDRYRSVLSRDPQNLRAQTGLQRVAVGLLAQARKDLANGRLDEAKAKANDARQIAPNLDGLGEFQRQLRDAGERRDIRETPRSADPAQAGKVAKLLDEAALLVARGDLIDPPGNNAYDKYSSILNIDGSNPEARAGLNNLPAAAKRFFEASTTAGRLSAAGGYLSVVQQLAADDPSLRTMEQRLAQSWLDQGLLRLKEGKGPSAKKAFSNARKIRPNLPGLLEAETQVANL